MPGLLSAQTTAGFSFPDKGGMSVTTPGIVPALRIGYGEITHSKATPVGFAVYGLRQNDALISEVTVPAANKIREGRIFAETSSNTNTGLALANPGPNAHRIAFYFTDASGFQSRADTFEMAPGEQLSRFLTEPPFNGSASFEGTFTFFVVGANDDLPLSAIAIRGLVNEREEFLLTTLPVMPLGANTTFTSHTIPHFVTGSGWSTNIVLINTEDNYTAGTLTFFNQAGQPVVVNTDRGASSQVSYLIAPRSFWDLATSTSGSTIVGSVHLDTSIPGITLPASELILSRREFGVTVDANGIPPTRDDTDWRAFVERWGQFSDGAVNSYETGVAISNASSSNPVHVTVTLTTLTGEETEHLGEFDIPAHGQIARFLHELPGFAALPPFIDGVLHISTDGTPVTVIGLRGRYNEREEFISTTVPCVGQHDSYFFNVLQISDFTFPHIVDGGGYATQIVFFSGWTAGDVDGTLTFFDTAGLPLDLNWIAQ